MSEQMKVFRLTKTNGVVYQVGSRWPGLDGKPDQNYEAVCCAIYFSPVEQIPIQPEQQGDQLVVQVTPAFYEVWAKPTDPAHTEMQCERVYFDQLGSVSELWPKQKALQLMKDREQGMRTFFEPPDLADEEGDEEGDPAPDVAPRAALAVVPPAQAP